MAQAEFERARRRCEPEAPRTNECGNQRRQTSPGGQSFLYRANANISDGNDLSGGGLALHAQKTAFQGGNDHSALRAQEPLGSISHFYDESGDIDEESKDERPSGLHGVTASARFGDVQPLCVASKMVGSDSVQRQTSNDNPPILQMLRLHKQLSDKKQVREGGSMSLNSEEERCMLTRQDEMLAAQAQMKELELRDMREADRFTP